MAKPTPATPHPKPLSLLGRVEPVIMLAVRWYLRFGLSYRDLEELLLERDVEVDHVTLFRWVQRFTPRLIASETLRIKAWLAVTRNQTRDYLDIAALADSMGVEQAARILRHIDDYYAEVNRKPEAVATQLARQLAEPRPRDHLVTKQLASYKGLDPRWHRWDDVRAVLTQLVVAMVTVDE